MERAGLPEQSPEAKLSWRPLYPERVRQRDMLTTALAIAKFLRNEGYWPKNFEVTRALSRNGRPDHGAVAITIRFLEEQGYVARLSRSSSHAVWVLTPQGWNLIGLAPIEPWRRRPSKMLIRRAVTATAARIMRLEQAAKERGA